MSAPLKRKTLEEWAAERRKLGRCTCSTCWAAYVSGRETRSLLPRDRV